MSQATQAFLPELAEAAATGPIAAIYAEIRRFSGVAYVSSLQRYLATLPQALEWAWSALRPAMASGAIPETGWRLARDVRLRPAQAVAPATLRRWGIDAAALAELRNIAANFVRVSPVNIVMGAALARLLTAPPPAGRGFPEAWTPPDPLPPMPGNVDAAALPPAQHAVLLRFATEIGGTPFIPALYRQVAHWPPVLAWLADELVPRLAAPETDAARAAFRAAAIAAAPDIVARLPGLPDTPPPDPATAAQIIAAIDRYAQTSPEMTMFGRLMLEALPTPGAL